MIDAAEIGRLREETIARLDRECSPLGRQMSMVDTKDLRALIAVYRLVKELHRRDVDALEQAQKERDELVGELNAWSMIAQQRADQRDAAQKDAKDARALLAIAVALVSDHPETCSCGRCGLRARIEAMLEQKIDNKDYLPHIVSND